MDSLELIGMGKWMKKQGTILPLQQHCLLVRSAPEICFFEFLVFWILIDGGALESIAFNDINQV